MESKISRLLAIRAKTRMRFVRRGVHDKKRLSTSWRMPKGRHNKMRRQLKAKGALPTPGYGSPRGVRGLHPSGYREVLVSNEKMLERVDPKEDAVRISGSVGLRKWNSLQHKALHLGIKVLNPKNFEVSEEESPPVTQSDRASNEVPHDE